MTRDAHGNRAMLPVREKEKEKRKYIRGKLTAFESIAQFFRTMELLTQPVVTAEVIAGDRRYLENLAIRHIDFIVPRLRRIIPAI